MDGFLKSKLTSNTDSALGKSELRVLREELKLKDFEQQKLMWQLGEREKELRSLYEELSAQLDLNDKLNTQLEKYQKLLRIIS